MLTQFFPNDTKSPHANPIHTKHNKISPPDSQRKHLTSHHVSSENVVLIHPIVALEIKYLKYKLGAVLITWFNQPDPMYIFMILWIGLNHSLIYSQNLLSGVVVFMFCGSIFHNFGPHVKRPLFIGDWFVFPE